MGPLYQPPPNLHTCHLHPVRYNVRFQLNRSVFNRMHNAIRRLHTCATLPTTVSALMLSTPTSIHPPADALHLLTLTLSHALAGLPRCALCLLHSAREPATRKPT